MRRTGFEPCQMLSSLSSLPWPVDMKKEKSCHIIKRRGQLLVGSNPGPLPFVPHAACWRGHAALEQGTRLTLC